MHYYNIFLFHQLVQNDGWIEMRKKEKEVQIVSDVFDKKKILKKRIKVYERLVLA